MRYMVMVRMPALPPGGMSGGIPPSGAPLCGRSSVVVKCLLVTVREWVFTAGGERRLSLSLLPPSPPNTSPHTTDKDTHRARLKMPETRSPSPPPEEGGPITESPLVVVGVSVVVVVSEEEGRTHTIHASTRPHTPRPTTRPTRTCPRRGPSCPRRSSRSPPRAPRRPPSRPRPLARALPRRGKRGKREEGGVGERAGGKGKGAPPKPGQESKQSIDRSINRSMPTHTPRTNQHVLLLPLLLDRVQRGEAHGHKLCFPCWLTDSHSRSCACAWTWVW